MSITFEFEGAAELQLVLKAAHDEIRDRYRDLVKRTTTRIHDDALGRVNRVTGNLADSAQIEASSGGYFGRVRFKAPHAHLVEYGHVGAPAHPFLTPAVESAQPEFFREAEEILREAEDGDR